MARRRIGSGLSVAERSVVRRRICSSTIFISSRAKLAPMQRRIPPPNGIQA
jgi:hypothetical protein